MRTPSRVVAVDVGPPGASGVRVQGLRIAFNVKRSSSSTVDPASVRLWNPSDGTIGAVRRPGNVTRLFAGYESAGQIAYGTLVRDTFRVNRDGVDTIAEWQIQEVAQESRNIAISESFRGPIRASVLIDRFLSLTAWARGSVRLPVDVEFSTGYAIAGRLYDALDDITRSCGATWVVEGGVLSVWPAGEDRRRTGTLITPDSGMVGSPRETEDGIEVTTLLDPGASPGDIVRVRSRYLSGGPESDLLVTDVEHVGDSGWDVQFYTVRRGRAL